MSLDNISQQNIEEIDTETEEDNLKKIEAALFIAGRFVSIKELITLTDINPILIKKILSDLQDKYKDAGVNIIQREDNWKMDVAENYTSIVNKFASGSSEFTKAEQETLAMIAHKQPMKQSVIIRIRGNKAYDHIKKFLDIGLVNKKKSGHTSEITLTESFYDYFHVNRGEELQEASV